MDINSIGVIQDEDVLDILWHGVVVGTLSFVTTDVGDFYIFKFDWNTYDKLGIDFEVPGVGMSARKEYYIRDYCPEFLSEYCPPAGREDIPDIMKQFGMTGEYTVWKFMKITGRNVTYDDYRVRPHVGRVIG